MRTLFAALAMLVLTGCAVLEGIAQKADVALQVPAARADLLAFLPPGEFDAIAPSLARLDRSYEEIASAVFGQSDITVADALSKLVGADITINQLETAHATVKAAVIGHAAASGEDVPESLQAFNMQLEAQWDDLTDFRAANVRAELYVKFLAKIALASATGVPL